MEGHYTFDCWSMSAMEIYRQLTLRNAANFLAFIDLPLVWS
jgi:hypothetical protein